MLFIANASKSDTKPPISKIYLCDNNTYRSILEYLIIHYLYSTIYIHITLSRNHKLYLRCAIFLNNGAQQVAQLLIALNNITKEF